MSKTLKYKDTTVAQGSKLHAAITDGDLKLAEKIYQECEKEYRKYWVKRLWEVDDEPTLRAEHKMLQERVDAGISVYCEQQRLEVVQRALDDIEKLKEVKVVTEFRPSHVSLVEGPDGNPQYTLGGNAKFRGDIS